MAHREFHDERGLPWEVWDVVPERRDRRSGVERRKHARETFDRRKMRVLSAVITGDLAKGWLVFSSTFGAAGFAPPLAPGATRRTARSRAGVLPPALSDNLGG